MIENLFLKFYFLNLLGKPINSIENDKNLTPFLNKSTPENDLLFAEKNEKVADKLQSTTNENSNIYDNDTDAQNEDANFVGFCRIFCGALKKGSVLYLFGPRYKLNNTNNFGDNIQQCNPDFEIYQFMV